MTTHSPRLTATLARLHAVLIGNPSTDPAPVTVRPLTPPSPAVRPPRPAPAPLRPSCAPLGTITDLDQLRSGPRRLLELLHQVGVSTVTARAYPVTPSQVMVHQPQELIARALGCHVVTVWSRLNL